MTTKLTVFALALSCCTAANAADFMRCGGKIIDRGASLAYVLALCGTPDVHVTREVPVRSRSPNGFSFTSGVSFSEQLIYDRGWGKFPAELEFVDGRLRRIEYLNFRR